MTQVVTPSMTTDGQISKAVANYRAMLEKHAPQYDGGVVQQVLGSPEFAAEQFAIFRKRVEMMTNVIIRRVKVDRSRAPQAMLDATGRRQYTTQSVVDAMPRGEGDEVDVHVFKPQEWEYTHPGFMSDDDLEKALGRRGLKSDPYAQGALNESDPAFANEHPNGTHWKDAQGKWCFATFHRWNDERDVNVNRYDNDWFDHWWFAGVPVRK